MIRPATAADVAALAAVQLRSALTAYRGIFPQHAPSPTHDGLAAGWARELAADNTVVMAADVGGAVVGGVVAAAATAPGVGNLRRLYVDPSSWGRGIGRCLHDTAVTACRDMGVTSMSLWVLEANHAARRHYERWGWQLSDGERFEHAGIGVVEVCYRLDLPR